MKAPLEERIAAHPFWTGEVLTPEQWSSLKEWRKENPDLVLHRAEEVANGRFFRQYHPTSRNGINVGTLESLEMVKEKKKIDYWENYEEQRIKKAEYCAANRELCAARSRDYYARNRDKAVAQKIVYARERRVKDDQFYLRNKMSMRLRRALLSGMHKKSTRIDAESVEFLLWQAEKLGVSARDFHVDHLFPISSFDLSDPKQQRVVNAPCNVWLMSEEDNLRKSNRFPTDEEIAAHGALLEEWLTTR